MVNLRNFKSIYNILFSLQQLKINTKVTYKVPLFLKQRIIKSWRQKLITFLFLLHKPLNLKNCKCRSLNVLKKLDAMVCHTLNPDSSATLPYKYDRYSSPTDMYEKCHLFSSTYLPRLNKGVPPP